MKSSEKGRLLTVFLMADNFYLMVFFLLYEFMYKFSPESITLLLSVGLTILITEYSHGQWIIP